MRHANEVVLGLGGCLDYETVWDAAVVEDLAHRYALSAADLDQPHVIRTERDLVQSLVAYLARGVGAERFVADARVVETFAGRLRPRVALGGTNLRAAITMSLLGRPSTVHVVSIDEGMRRLLPEGTAYLSSATSDSRAPHLVVQYPAGAEIRLTGGTVRAARANRLIYVNDAANREMRLSPELGPALERADIVLLSGLNGVQDPDLLTRRLGELRSHLEHLPPTARLVFEDAGYHQPGMGEQVRAALAPRLDVHGMNEDELQAYAGQSVDLLDATQVATAVTDVRRTVHTPTVVVHTQFWALAHGPGAEAYRTALLTGTRTAGARYLHGDHVTPADLRAVTTRTMQREASAFCRALEELMPDEVCCVPAYELSPDVPTTIGLGDAFVGGFIAGLAEGPRPTDTPNALAVSRLGAGS